MITFRGQSVSPRQLLASLCGRAARFSRQAVLLALAALALAAGLFAPRVTLERAVFDHVIVVDITQSMNTVDVRGPDGNPVSRLEGARTALRQALAALPCGSKVGWGVFTEYRIYVLAVPVEVCENFQELTSTLAHIDGRMAWAGASEVAKALHYGLRLLGKMDEPPSLVFVTDGHEAPPLDPRHRPKYDGTPGKPGGVVVGVGGAVPSPIPKIDPEGRALGLWRSDEVIQEDRSRPGAGEEAAAAPAAGHDHLGARPGQEHLSALREPYLQLIASEAGMSYVRADDPQALAAALTARTLARDHPVQTSLAPYAAGLALALLVAALWPVAHGLFRRRT